MKDVKQLSAREIGIGLGIAVLFLGTSFISERFAPTLRAYIGQGGVTGMVLYVLTIMGIVLVPFASSLPLVPVAVVVWGNVTASLLTLIGWILSGNIAFQIARRFGQPFLSRFALFEHIYRFGDFIPKRNLFTGMVVLGMFGAPADIVSYALGLFTKIPARFFTLAFGTGMVPFVFFLTFTTTLPIIYQTYIVGFMVIAWFFLYARLKRQSNGNAH
jgi:uncharacterized membrane protein YdjX (TVP38/TMEM64 family)